MLIFIFLLSFFLFLERHASLTGPNKVTLWFNPAFKKRYRTRWVTLRWDERTSFRFKLSFKHVSAHHRLEFSTYVPYENKAVSTDHFVLVRAVKELIIPVWGCYSREDLRPHTVLAGSRHIAPKTMLTLEQDTSTASVLSAVPIRPDKDTNGEQFFFSSPAG